MPSQQFIFVGFEVTGEMSAAFDNCPERDRAYLDDPAYLEIARIDGRKYVGKRIDSGAARDRLEDTARSVVSLLARVCGGMRLDPVEAALIASEEQRDPSAPAVVGVD
jgi:hypothetical protein